MIRYTGSTPEIEVTVTNVNGEEERLDADWYMRQGRNRKWLKTHWADLLPRVRGKYVTVAGEEAFIAETEAESRAQAKAAHPEDDAVWSQYVCSDPKCPYANNG